MRSRTVTNFELSVYNRADLLKTEGRPAHHQTSAVEELRVASSTEDVDSEYKEV